MSEDGEGPPQPVWEGAFDEDGLPHGQGTMRYPPPPVGEDEEEKPADLYEGYFEHGQRQGQGKYTWSNGSIFEGAYVENKKSGKGKLTIPTVGVYEGDFIDDRMEGHGLFSYTNGDKFMGTFKGAMRHGQGMYYFKEAQCQLIGEWTDDKFSTGRWVFKDGSVFYGNFEDSKPKQGAYFLSGSQLLQKGSFQDGAWQGDNLVVGTVEQVLKV